MMKLFLDKNPKRLIHYNISYEDVLPSIAVSALISLDDIVSPDDVARVVLNIFPFNNKTEVIFSYLAEEEKFVNEFLQEFFDVSNTYQQYLISKLVLSNCDNFVIAPDFYESWTEKKKKIIRSFFCQTILQNKPDYEDFNLQLFNKTRK